MDTLIDALTSALEEARKYGSAYAYHERTEEGYRFHFNGSSANNAAYHFEDALRGIAVCEMHSCEKIVDVLQVSSPESF